MRILIVKLGSIGDIIHTLPALAAIRAAIPAAEISWVAEVRSSEILHGSPLIDHLIEVDTRSLRGGRVIEDILPELRKQVRDIRKFRFDIAIDFQGLLKSAMIAKISGAGRRFGFSKPDLREPASRIFLTETVKIPPQIHVISKNLMLASEALGIRVPEHDFDFPIQTSDMDRAEASEIIAEAGEDFAVLNPAGGWVTKLWHAEKFGQLADRIWDELGLVSIVATGPAETGLAQSVLAHSRSGRTILTQPNLKGFYELVKNPAFTSAATPGRPTSRSRRRLPLSDYSARLSGGATVARTQTIFASNERTSPAA